jgi:hypothetical protein
MATLTQPQFPPVLLVEVNLIDSGDYPVRSTMWPEQLFRFMTPEMQSRALAERLQGPLSLGQFAESITSLLYFIRPPTISWNVNQDGSIQAPKASIDNLSRGINLAILVEKSTTYCTEVDAKFRSAVEELWSVAEKEHSSVVFYFSPRHPDYFNALEMNQNYQQCYVAFRTYIEQFRTGHQRVFFLDYMDPKRIPGLSGTPDYFYDEHHMTALSANLMLETATDTLHQAYQLAVEH